MHRRAKLRQSRFYYLSHAICYSCGADNNSLVDGRSPGRVEPRPLSASRSTAHGGRVR